MKTLKMSAKGPDVIKLKILLNGYLNPTIKIKNNGHFGKKNSGCGKNISKEERVN